MITKFKIFEDKEDVKLYGCVIKISDLQFYYDKIVEFNLDAKYYFLNKEECIVFVYIPEDIKINNFIGWVPQKDDFMKNKNKIPFDAGLYLNTKKYNL